MSRESKGTPPDLKNEIKKKLYGKFGRRGLIVWALIAVVALLLWNWEHAKTVPVLAEVINWVTREPIPLADSNRFSIAVAHLNGDKDRYSESLILEALKEHGGIQVLQFDRTIHIRTSKPEEAEKAGHAQAQKYLRQSGADVLIWGTVLSASGQTVLKLYWTTNSSTGWGRYEPTANLALPDLFWNDSKTVLAILVLIHQNQYKRGIPVISELSSQIEKIKSLLKGKSQNWEPEFRLLLRLLVAGSLAMLAEQSGNLPALEESRDIYQSLLQEVSREKNPYLWAWVQNSLGLVFMDLAFKGAGITYLEEAMKKFEEALIVRRRDTFPLDWARTTANIGVTHRFIGERKKGSEEISLGITYLRQALQELSPQRARGDWLLTQQRLAGALLEVGLRNEQMTELLEAKNIEEKVLEYWTAEASPIFWAWAQLTLGRILFVIGERRNSTEDLEKALMLFLALRKHYTRHANPFQWAQVEYQIGYALQTLGATDKSMTGTTRLKEAIKTMYEVLTVWTQETNLIGWSEAHLRIGAALTALGTREEGTKGFVEAEKVYRSALKIVTRKEMPFVWGSLNYGLGMTFFWWSNRTNDAQQLCQSYIHLREAWDTLAELQTDLQSSQAQLAVARIIDAFTKRYPKKDFSNCLNRAQRRNL